MHYVVLTIAFLATGAFYRAAIRAGFHPGKSASLPILALCIMFGLEWIGIHLINSNWVRARTSWQSRGMIELMLHIFLLLVYLMFIRRNWLVLQAAQSNSSVNDHL